MSRTPDKKLKPGVKLEDVCFYFDAVERDRLDASGTSRKTGEVLALRDRLLRLPDEQFDAAIKTLRSLVDDAGRGDSEDGPGSRRRAQTLYDASRGRGGSGGGGTGKVSPT